MNIKKFKNGSINLSLESSDKFYYSKYNTSYDTSVKDSMECIDIDSIYEVMTMDDLYFNQVNGYMYLIDYNTQRAYDFSDCYINILLYLKELLINSYNDNKVLKLYAMSNKDYKSLMEDLENGY